MAYGVEMKFFGTISQCVIKYWSKFLTEKDFFRFSAITLIPTDWLPLSAELRFLPGARVSFCYSFLERLFIRPPIPIPFFSGKKYTCWCAFTHGKVESVFLTNGCQRHSTAVFHSIHCVCVSLAAVTRNTKMVVWS